MHRYLIFVIVLMPSEIYSQKFDVNRAYWGMSPREVAISEGRPPDWEGFDANSGLYELMYNRERREGIRAFHIGRYRYLFFRMKLAKVTYAQRWGSDRFQRMNRVKSHYLKEGAKLVKTTDNNRVLAHYLEVSRYTHLTLVLHKSSDSGKYQYFAIFEDIEYKRRNERENPPRVVDDTKDDKNKKDEKEEDLEDDLMF